LSLSRSLARRIGPEKAALPPFSLGDAGTIRVLAAGAGFREVKLRAEAKMVRFRSAEHMVRAVVGGALIALGQLCKGDCFEFWKIPPFLPLWVAARTAAAEENWTLAALCLKRALVDIVVFADALNPAQEAEVHSFAFDPRFIKDLYLRLRDTPGPAAQLRLAFRLALHSVRASPLYQWSQLFFVLLEVARRLGVRRTDESLLAHILGDTLYSRIDSKTRGLLADAEAGWLSQQEVLDKTVDYGLIGLAYRCAIENEWRTRLGSRLHRLDSGIDPARPTLGEMLRFFKTPRILPGQQLLRAVLADTVSRDSRLFDQAFLQRTSRLALLCQKS
jgi:hypothetical protein